MGAPSIDTVVGHSYGTTLVGAAASDGHHLAANNIVAVASPGMLVDHAGDLKLPPGVDGAKLIAEVGDVWQSWGWWVFERDGIHKPNRSGFSPDGYELHIGMPGLPGPPNITASSPCFPHDIARDDLPFPSTISA